MKLLGILVIYSPSKDFKLYISWRVCSSPTPISKGARYSCWSLKTFLPASNLCLSLATACPLCGPAKARLVFSVPGWNRISIHPGHSCLDVFGVFLSWAQVTRKAQAIPVIYKCVGHSVPHWKYWYHSHARTYLHFSEMLLHQPHIQLFFLGLSDKSSNPFSNILITWFSVLPLGPPLHSPPLLDPPLSIKVLSTSHP